MTTTIKRFITGLILALGLMVPALIAAPASAQNVDQSLCNGANFNFTGGEDENSSCVPGDAGAGAEVDSIVADVINIISLVVGVVSVIMIIIGGLRYITSNGDSGNVTNAKNTILYAIIGLVVVALAQLLVRFVIERVATTAE